MSHYRCKLVYEDYTPETESSPEVVHTRVEKNIPQDSIISIPDFLDHLIYFACRVTMSPTLVYKQMMYAGDSRRLQIENLFDEVIKARHITKRKGKK